MQKGTDLASKNVSEKILISITSVLLINKYIKSKFDRFFLGEINQTKIGNDGQDHNKLRLYKTLK